MNYESNEAAVKNPDVIVQLKREVEVFNQQFGQTEQIKKFELLPSEWTVESGELTPSLKLKRKAIEEKYRTLIEKIYKND